MEEIRSKLDDWFWRLNNLYTFVDWDGGKRIFTMNEAQVMLFFEMHHKNIILKCRQWGITTYEAIFMLDAILFRKDCRCLFVAHTRDDAEKIFNHKVRYAYSNLPDWLKAEKPLLKENGGQIIVDHGDNSNSSLEVAVSGRGGTYDYIHVSELGKIAASDPLKAAELVSGTLNSGAKAIVTIESTAEGDSGVFYEMCTTAEEDKLLGRYLSRLDYKFFFLSWIGHPNYTFSESESKDIVLLDETLKYFDGMDVSREQMCWYQSKKREQKDKMPQEFPTTSVEAFSRPMEGAFYAKQLRAMMESGRICDVEWNPEYPVYTYCDIGHTDYTVNLYVQYIGRYVHIFDMYVGDSKLENNDMTDMINDLKGKPYRYGGHIAPHDMGVFEWGSGVTRKERALNDHGIDFKLAPKEIGLLDGIDMVKAMLPYVVVDKNKCRPFISGMRAYRRKRLPDGSLSSKPDHDGSDFADPARYIAVTQYLIDLNDVVNIDIVEEGACL